MVYADPGQEPTRIVNAVAAGGTILPITPPGTNASWTIDLEMPKLSCNAMNASLRQSVEENIYQALNETIDYPYSPSTGSALTASMFAYLGWVSPNAYAGGKQYQAKGIPILHRL